MNTGTWNRVPSACQVSPDCITATSPPSERVFSAAGLTVTRLRSRLTQSRNTLIFLNKNQETGAEVAGELLVIFSEALLISLIHC